MTRDHVDKYPSIKRGTVGDRKIYYSFFAPKKKSDIYVVLFHGSFSSSLSGEKDHYLIDALVEKGINVFAFETSRGVHSWEFNGPFDEYKKVFGYKTFQDEKEDVENIFDFFLETYIKANERAKIYFSGSSLGGTLCSYLLPKHGKRVTAVFLFGSGVTTKGGTNTYPGYPTNKQEILNNFKQCCGKIILVQGTEDTVVPQKEALEILEGAKKAGKTKHILLRGVDHSFRKINGKLAIENVAKKITAILLDQIDLP